MLPFVAAIINIFSGKKADEIDGLIKGAKSGTRPTKSPSEQAKAQVNDKYHDMVEKYDAKFSSGGNCEPRVLNKLDHKEARIKEDLEYLDRMQDQVDRALSKFKLNEQKDK